MEDQPGQPGHTFKNMGHDMAALAGTRMVNDTIYSNLMVPQCVMVVLDYLRKM